MMKFEITEIDYRIAVSNLAIAEERGKQILLLQALLERALGAKLPAPPDNSLAKIAEMRETSAIRDRKIKELAEKLDRAGRKISELLGAVHHLDKVCGILNLELPARPVTYDEVPRIVESLMAHRDSAQEKCVSFQKSVHDLQKRLKERAAAALSLERSVTRMAKNTDALRPAARVVVDEAISAYGGKAPPDGTPMGRLHEAVQCMDNADGIGSC